MYPSFDEKRYKFNVNCLKVFPRSLPPPRVTFQSSPLRKYTKFTINDSNAEINSAKLADFWPVNHKHFCP